jgi:hypothetical protein
MRKLLLLVLPLLASSACLFPIFDDDQETVVQVGGDPHACALGPGCYYGSCDVAYDEPSLAQTCGWPAQPFVTVCADGETVATYACEPPPWAHPPDGGLPDAAFYPDAALVVPDAGPWNPPDAAAAR